MCTRRAAFKIKNIGAPVSAGTRPRQEVHSVYSWYPNGRCKAAPTPERRWIWVTGGLNIDLDCLLALAEAFVVIHGPLGTLLNGVNATGLAAQSRADWQMITDLQLIAKNEQLEAGLPQVGLGARIKRWLDDTPRGLLGTLADFIQVATVLFAAVSLIVTKGAVAAIMASALSVIALTSLVIIWRLETALRRKSRSESAGIAIPGLAAAIADMTRAHQALRDGEAGASRAFVQLCEQACKDFATALTAMTGRTCRVTLHEVYVPENGLDTDWSVQKIAGSYGPQPEGRSDDAVDLICDNTDFDLIMNGAPIYLCNDLVEAISTGYRNSHWTPEKLAEWHRTGEYPYRSTVVWPLRESVVRDGDTIFELAGFLSVDASESGTFDRDTVQPLGEAVAHAAYIGLVTYRDLKREGLWDESSGSMEVATPSPAPYEPPTTAKSS